MGEEDAHGVWMDIKVLEKDEEGRDRIFFAGEKL